MSLKTSYIDKGFRVRYTKVPAISVAAQASNAESFNSQVIPCIQNGRQVVSEKNRIARLVRARLGIMISIEDASAGAANIPEVEILIARNNIPTTEAQIQQQYANDSSIPILPPTPICPLFETDTATDTDYHGAKYYWEIPLHDDVILKRSSLVVRLDTLDVEGAPTTDMKVDCLLDYYIDDTMTEKEYRRMIIGYTIQPETIERQVFVPPNPPE